MTNEQIKGLLNILADKQKDCAPIALKIGYTDKKQFVHHDTVVITRCAPSVTKMLITEGYNLGVHDDGVHVDRFE